MNLFENLQKLNESFYPEITVELYKNNYDDPIRKHFDDEYDKAIQFANDNINKNFESIYITISTPNGPSTLDVWEKDSGWYIDPKQVNINNYFDDDDADYFIDNDLFTDEEEFEESLNESSGNYNEYGINYRNMRTAIHGLIVFDNEQKAINAYNQLKNLENCTNDIDYEIILEEVLSMSNYIIDEIDYRDISDDLVYDNIKIINLNSVDLYGM